MLRARRSAKYTPELITALHAAVPAVFCLVAAPSSIWRAAEGARLLFVRLFFQARMACGYALSAAGFALLSGIFWGRKQAAALKALHFYDFLYRFSSATMALWPINFDGHSKARARAVFPSGRFTRKYAEPFAARFALGCQVRSLLLEYPCRVLGMFCSVAMATKNLDVFSHKFEAAIMRNWHLMMPVQVLRGTTPFAPKSRTHYPTQEYSGAPSVFLPFCGESLMKAFVGTVAGLGLVIAPGQKFLPASSARFVGFDRHRGIISWA